LIATDEPARVVAELAKQMIIVTEKPNGIRVATDFFNTETEIDRLIEAL
jgi:selenocysteine lyase/cysteine desulfurase